MLDDRLFRLKSSHKDVGLLAKIELAGERLLLV